LVLLHGWSASLRCWGDDVVDEFSQRYKVVAVDLRGHGYSGAPETGYDDAANWAADVAAVLDAEASNGDAVLLGWSYGGLVVCDYLAEHGTALVAGIVLTGAITGIGRDQGGGQTGPTMVAAIPGVFAESPGQAVRAFAGFGNANTGPGDDKGVIAQLMFGTSLSTPPRVRSALFRRNSGHDELLAALDIPALILHGTADPVVDVASAEHAAQLIPDVATSFWDGAQHGLFVEDPARFVTIVSEFVDGLQIH
jgi:non-heme chloroperoxidase